MKASHYHNKHTSSTQKLMCKYAQDTPLGHEKLGEVEWKSDKDELIFYDNLEDSLGIPFSDEELGIFFDGNIKVAELIDVCETMEKHAKKTTPQERARMKKYYQQNKDKIKRKAKIRRKRQKSGTKKKMKRHGTAAGGYTFTQDTSGPGSSGGSGIGSSRGGSAKRKSYKAGKTGKSKRNRKLGR